MDKTPDTGERAGDRRAPLPLSRPRVAEAGKSLKKSASSPEMPLEKIKPSRPGPVEENEAGRRGINEIVTDLVDDVLAR
jgi:hypothetical protein